MQERITEVVDTANQDADRLYDDISNSLDMKDLVS